MFLFKRARAAALPDFRYRAVREVLWSAELGKYRTYAIRAFARREGRWRSECILHDVSTDRDFVAALARKFTLHRLSPVHLRDVVDDMLP